MKGLIVTVAGISSRFGESIGEPCIKCLYNNGGIKTSLLYRITHTGVEFDKFIIVGGYRFDELSLAIRENFSDIKDKIILVNNEMYREYGSGYSLYEGIKKALEEGCDEIVFAEGDLYLDRKTFCDVCDSDKSVISYTNEKISADKSVIYYINGDDKLRYVYDTKHGMLEINEPFKSVANSGQVWKFSDISMVRRTLSQMDEAEWHGTNLVFTEKYLNGVGVENINFIGFKNWLNCNTVVDFNKIEQIERDGND